MEYKKLSEMNYSIFTELEKIASDLQIFKYSTGVELDTVFNFKYSERLINPLCETKTSAEIAQIVKILCSYTWDNVIESISSLTPNSNTITNTSKTETPTETTTTVNEVSAYNADDYSNNDKSTVNRDGSTVTSETNNTESTNYSDKKDYYNIFTNLSFYDKIFIDVINVISLFMY